MNLGNLSAILRENPYPGRGILLGRTADGACAVVTYFIMGRSENSRNRVFAPTPDGIRTQAFDESKMTDPSLILYHPLRVVNGLTIVSNGDQTDTIRDSIANGYCFRHALKRREFEPDAPNFTPRISGVVKPNGTYDLSIVKTLDGDPSCCCRYFFEYDHPKAGTGHFISTYHTDGAPLPSFCGEPLLVAVDEPTAQKWAEKLWNSLNFENKVSLFVRFIHLATQETEDVILNKNGGAQ